jgi:hypothetical protein
MAKDTVEDLDGAWPSEVLEAIGSFPDFPEVTELRSGYGTDVPREPLAGGSECGPR